MELHLQPVCGWLDQLGLSMRAGGQPGLSMGKRIISYVAGVCIAAIALATAVAVVSPAEHEKALATLIVLAVLAVAAEALTILMPHATRGSVAYIAYLACILIAPGPTSILVILVVKTGVELLQSKEWSKRVFNVAQHGVSVSLATLVYIALEGPALAALSDTSIAHLSRVAALPAFVAIAVSTVANTLLVVGAISISKGKSLLGIFREVKLPMIGNDLLASPVVLVFAWILISFGPLAASVMWVPILGLRQLNKANVELEQMNRELLQLMVKSIEARDPYTSGHSRRVQEYATTIARGMKLSEREIERISQAALLHDVGKINEKYHPILTKPDKLTAAEWAVMKEHPIDGANLVGTMTRLRHLIPAIRHHHENWDGTGYPDGIAGELIPLEARVIALADTIDAMTSERPYRPGLSAEQVRAEVVRCRGKQFDPRVADRVLSSDVWRKLFPIEPARPDDGGLRLLRVSEKVS